VIETASRATFREVLAEPVFRVVFYARTLAIAADVLRIVALSMLIFQSTGSAALAAATFGAGFVPQVLGGMLFGALPDLVRPRRLIVLGYAAECAGALGLAVFDVPVWASLLIVAVIGGLAPVLHGGSARLIADALTGDAYVLGRSMLTMTSALAQLAGLAGGGVAAATIGPRHTLLLCAACHLLAASTTRLLLPDLPAGRRGERAAVRQSWRGNRQLLADRPIRVLLLTQWLPPAFVTGAESLLIPYAQVRHFPPGSGGLLLACLPVGMLIGNGVVARLLASRAQERAVIPLIAVLGTPLVAFAFDIGPVPAGLLLFLVGLGFAFGLGVQRRFLDAIPEDSRGQAFALMSTGLMTLQGIGPMVIGAVAETIPIGMAIGAAGIGTLGIAGWLTRYGFQSSSVHRDSR
jgi:predicted MFS family arabinose efflux permease